LHFRRHSLRPAIRAGEVTLVEVAGKTRCCRLWVAKLAWGEVKKEMPCVTARVCLGTSWREDECTAPMRTASPRSDIGFFCNPIA